MKNTPRPLPHDLLAAQRDIDLWRKSNGRRRRISESFWQRAAKLAGVHGVNRVADAMRLSHTRIASVVSDGVTRIEPTGGQNQDAHFVELTRPMPAAHATTGLAVELADGSSRRMRITGTDAQTTAHILTAFFGMVATS